MAYKIKELLTNSINYLDDKGVENSKLDAVLLLCHLLKVDRVYILTYSDKEIEVEVAEEYNKMLQMRSEGMPLQYITGNQEFMSLPFKVTKDVLIPRGDTETLVEYVIKWCEEMKPIKQQINAVDIGTGSGCISVSMAHYIKNIHITAYDISQDALNIAEENAKINGVQDRIKFILHDILKGFLLDVNDNSIDIVVSNPPYIPTGVIEELQIEVKDYEPFCALDGGNDGLIFYRVIVEIAHKYLRQGGLLAFEVGHDQSSLVCDLIEKNKGYQSPEVIKDLAGINRVVIAEKK